MEKNSSNIPSSTCEKDLLNRGGKNSQFTLNFSTEICSWEKKGKKCHDKTGGEKDQSACPFLFMRREKKGEEA